MNFDDFAPPVRVEGGLRAKTARGAIGRSWWSRRFLAVLESFALGTRLTRGRAYARAGQVLSLDIAPGVVTASVQGSRPAPYRVSIRLAAFSEPGWCRIEVLLSEQALYSAQLLAGEVPPDLEQVFTEAGTPLFPTAVRELDMRCSCPDAAVPCKHLAATFYLLAEAFDADPFQILQWRGRSREALLERLRTLRTGFPDGAGADAMLDGPAPDPAGAVTPAPTIGAATALVDLVEQPLTEVLDLFWLAPQPLPGRPPTPGAEVDLLLRQLPEPGADLGGPDLVERLQVAYRRFSQGAFPSEPGARADEVV